MNRSFLWGLIFITLLLLIIWYIPTHSSRHIDSDHDFPFHQHVSITNTTTEPWVSFWIMKETGKWYTRAKGGLYPNETVYIDIQHTTQCIGWTATNTLYIACLSNDHGILSITDMEKAFIFHKTTHDLTNWIEKPFPYTATLSNTPPIYSGTLLVTNALFPKQTHWSITNALDETSTFRIWMKDSKPITYEDIVSGGSFQVSMSSECIMLLAKTVSGRISGLIIKSFRGTVLTTYLCSSQACAIISVA